MKILSLATLAVLWVGSVGHAAGLAHNDNFIVFAQSGVTPRVAQELADSLMIRAGQYRKQIAEDWLGSPLPSGVGRATINLRLSDLKDTGLTWAIDHPSRKTHTVYLVTSADKALGQTLAHEMVHVVLATRFPHPYRLPAWLEEGIASQYDDPNRCRMRDEVRRWWILTKKWPPLISLLNAHNIHAEERESYAAAASLTSMLLERGGKEKLLEFGQSASRSGWREALQSHYQIRDVAELERVWQSWVMQAARGETTIRLSQRRAAP